MKLPFMLRSTAEKALTKQRYEIEFLKNQIELVLGVKRTQDTLAEMIEFVSIDTALHETFKEHKQEFLGRQK